MFWMIWIKSYWIPVAWLWIRNNNFTGSEHSFSVTFIRDRVLTVSIVRVGALWIAGAVNWKTAIARNLFEREVIKGRSDWCLKSGNEQN